MTAPADVPMRPSLIIEGLCPYGHGPLVRREDDGFCTPCGFGYFVDGDSFGFTMEFLDPAQAADR